MGLVGEPVRDPGARALDAGIPEAGAQTSPARLTRRLPSALPLPPGQSRGVTTFTSLPGIWITRRGAVPAR